MNDDKPYSTGYGKPPVTSQFKPGQSGNPKGRPKGSSNRSLAQDLLEELADSVVVSEGGFKKKLTKQQVVTKALVNKAMKGGTARWMWNIMQEAEEKASATQNETSRQQVSAAIREAQMVLDRYQADRPLRTVHQDESEDDEGGSICNLRE